MNVVIYWTRVRLGCPTETETEHIKSMSTSKIIWLCWALSLSLFVWIKCRKNYGKWAAVSKSREQGEGHSATRRHAISVSARSGISLSRALRAACPICLLVFALISSLISATLVCLPSVPPSVRPSVQPSIHLSVQLVCRSLIKT